MREGPGGYQWNAGFNEYTCFNKRVDPARQNKMIMGYMGLLAGSHVLDNCKDEVSWLEVLL